MYTIGQLTKEFGVSRSTLLYYDKIGLLKPTARNNSNYRVYSPSDFERLRKIISYKTAGLDLDAIATILTSPESESASILEARLVCINTEISQLRKQQQRLVQLLGPSERLKLTKTMNKEQWVAILEASGMTEADMRKWHKEFEKSLPEMHSDFLESLGINHEEINIIKEWSKPEEIKLTHWGTVCLGSPVRK